MPSKKKKLKQYQTIVPRENFEFILRFPKIQL